MRIDASQRRKWGRAIRSLIQQRERPRVLIVEDDRSVSAATIEALARPCCAPANLKRERQRAEESVLCGCVGGGASPCVTIVRTLKQLHDTDLGVMDMIICAVGLPDGSGLDALAYVRGTRPELPVILTGEPGDWSVGVEAIRAGAVDFLVTSSGDLHQLPLVVEKSLTHHRVKQENERLHRDLSSSLAELAQKNQQLQAVIGQLQMMARTDELTGLCNRRWLNETLRRAWAEALRHSRPLGFLMIDLDGLKDLNDMRGHQSGDSALRLAGKVIAANCRQVDTAARYGGDEFCLLMPQTKADESVQVAERIRREFDLALRSAAADDPKLGMSIGVSHIDLSRPINAEQLVQHADEAMYAAKSAGKQRVMVRNAGGIFAPISKN